jgi:peptide/nickel transport system substrate-binding protein
MPNVLDELTSFWKEHGDASAAEKATPLQIEAWEQRYNVVLPADLRDYVMRVNGILGGENLEFDHEGISFLPLSAMCTEAEWTESTGKPNRFVFADFLVKCHWWCAIIDDTSRERTEIYLGGCGSQDDRPIASSLDEFFHIYMHDHGAIYPRADGAVIRRHRKGIGSLLSKIRGFFPVILIALLLLYSTGCHTPPTPPNCITVILESSPNNLDLRQGTDAQSERVGGLIFDALVKKDEHYNLRPWLATAWEQPDPLTWVFHLRDGVRFHDGRPLEAADVVWTIQSLIDPTLAHLISPKSGNFASVDHAEAPDRLTVIVHLKRPDAGLLFNMSDGLFGVVPRGAGSNFGLAPIGSGRFRFVSQVQDKEVVLERAPNSWSTDLSELNEPVQRIRFSIVPDTITSALEMQKNSADVASNVLTLDMVHALEGAPGLAITSGPGSNVWYINFNVEDPTLRDKRVRQAVALAIDRPAIIAALWRGHAQLADTLLPIGHWARAADSDLAQYPLNPTRAAALLEAAGFHPDKNGTRLHLTLKISTDETTRLLAVILQQQLRAAGIALNIRSAEFGTFYADVTHGAFQMYILKWVGSNEDPDIFRYMYSSSSFPPKGANRGHYINPRIDTLLTAAAAESGLPDQVQSRRRTAYIEIQKILADEMPSIPLWYPENEVVHTARIEGIHSDADGNYDFLRTAQVR